MPEQFITSSGQVIFLDGCKMKSTYEPSLYDALGDDYTSLKPWEPIYKRDLQLTKDINILKHIVNRVKNHNESHDIQIVGDRGRGKSALAVGLSILLHNLYSGGKSVFPISQVCFTLEEYVACCDSLKDVGGIVILDEVGVSGSMSSRESMSKGNRSSSDLIQLMRTDRIITILISLDRDRIDKRIRQTSSLLMTPIRKLSSKENNNLGLALECDCKIRRTRPAKSNEHNWHSENDSGYLIHEVSPFHYSEKGLLFSLVIPHPPVKIWHDYSIKRDKKLEQIRTAAFVAYNGEQQVITAKKAPEQPEKPKKTPVKSVSPAEKQTFIDRMEAEARKRMAEAENQA